MAKSTVSVGCKLPNGIVLEVGATKVTLNGVNKELIAGSGYGLTEVDSEFWTNWVAENMAFAPFQNNAIFQAKDAQSVAAAAVELSGEKTGLEPMEQTAAGVKPADKE